MTKQVWICNCGIYWLWSEEKAREHEKTTKHHLSEISLSDEEFRNLTLLILSNRTEYNRETPFPFEKASGILVAKVV